MITAGCRTNRSSVDRYTRADSGTSPLMNKYGLGFTAATVARGVGGAEGRILLSPPDRSWRNTQVSAEHPAEVAHIGQSNGMRGVHHARLRTQQQRLRPVHPARGHELVRRE